MPVTLANKAKRQERRVKLRKASKTLKFLKSLPEEVRKEILRPETKGKPKLDFMHIKKKPTKVQFKKGKK